jgi:hypothetical protein
MLKKGTDKCLFAIGTLLFASFALFNQADRWECNNPGALLNFIYDPSHSIYSFIYRCYIYAISTQKNHTNIFASLLRVCC